MQSSQPQLSNNPTQLDYTIIIHRDLIAPDTLGMILSKLDEFQATLLDQVSSNIGAIPSLGSNVALSGASREFLDQIESGGNNTEESTTTTNGGSEHGQAISLTSHGIIFDTQLASDMTENERAQPITAKTSTQARRVILSVTQEKRSSFIQSLQEIIAEITNTTAPAVEILEL